MKNFLTLLLFALITSFSFGQNNYQDVIHLKNGNIIRGIIIEQVPNESIKIETADRNVFIYQMDEIEKLSREPYKGKSGSITKGGGLQKGYKGKVELGYEIGIGAFSLDRLKLNIINSYQINPYFSMGIGTGLRYYYDAEASLIPVFADLRANFMDNNVSPYVSLGAGYSFDITNSTFSGGLLINPTIGVSFMVSDKSAMNVGIGYEAQSVKFKSFSLYGSSSQNISAISINFGISF